MAHPADAQAVLDAWFGVSNDHGLAAKTQRRLWFNATPGFDAHLRGAFGATVQAALAGRLEHWTASASGTLALILLLDQFPRNIFRQTSRAFAGDRRALALARRLVQRGADLQLRGDARTFAYLPFEHAESREAQATLLGLLSRWLDEARAGQRAWEVRHVASNLRAARQHAAIVQQFGRFPHRNAVLARTSTPAELAFLATAANRFGQ